MGQLQNNPSARRSTSRLGPRICLRKGCGHSYQPQHWKQRYCQDSECLREVRRWQAAKRQQRRRRRLEVRQQRAAAERERRARRREGQQGGDSSTTDRPAGDAPRHAAGAWSRKERSSAPFCDRVGCYETLRHCSNGQARYCGEECRRDVARVRDRERKWLSRKTLAGRFKRHLEYEAWRSKCSLLQHQTANPRDRNLALDCDETVLHSRDSADSGIPCRDSQQVTGDDRETHPDPKSRPPPSS